MQQTMDEITEYLAKIDDLLRAQKDAVFADMIGVELLVDEAMTVRAEVGRVSEVTWSKLQGSAATIARTQAYALRQLDGLAEKLERSTKIGDLADLSKQAQETVLEWLGVLARCYQLQEALAVFELDRVLVTSPDELDHHRVALQSARQRRLQLIATTTTQLVDRMETAAGRAKCSRTRCRRGSSCMRATMSRPMLGFFTRVWESGISVSPLRPRRWSVAAGEARDDMIGVGMDGLNAVGRFGNDALENTRMSAGRLAGGIANCLQRTDETAATDTFAADEAGDRE